MVKPKYEPSLILEPALLTITLTMADEQSSKVPDTHYETFRWQGRNSSHFEVNLISLVLMLVLLFVIYMIA